MYPTLHPRALIFPTRCTCRARPWPWARYRRGEGRGWCGIRRVLNVEAKDQGKEEKATFDAISLGRTDIDARSDLITFEIAVADSGVSVPDGLIARNSLSCLTRYCH